MVRRAIYSILITVIFVPRVATASFLSKLGIGLNPGAILTLSGNYSGSQSLGDVVLPGSGLGLSLRYQLNRNLFIDGGFSYNWMFFRADKRPSDYASDKPALVVPMYTLNITFYPAPGHTIAPYLTAGGGICPWWFSSRASGGVLWLAPEDKDETFTQVSKMINGGLGIELRLGSKFSVLGEARYYHIFVKYEPKLGARGFGNQNLLGIRLGINFYFGSRESQKKDEESAP
jgi:hypothetical protein